MKNKTSRIIIFSLGLLIVATFIYFFSPIKDKILQTSNPSVNSKFTVIVDAGHGGMDGGAVGVDGIVEKDINLAIALKLKSMLEVNGINVILTRDEDESIHDEDAKTAKQQKTSDLHNRMEFMKENPNAIFVSIHQNKFTKSSSSGAQVFYGTINPESAVLAESIQKTIREAIQPENQRETKPTTSDIFLLHKAESVSVMVECGFLSNSHDAYLLIDDEYQNKMAFSIFAGIIRYFIGE